MEYRVDFEALPWTRPMAGVRAKVLRQGARQLRLVEYGCEMEPHWCDRGHYGCILAGEFEIRFADRTLLFRAGDGVHIPAGEAHRHMARALSPTVRAFFVEDF
ncbi:MAG: cupin domain-containing protein [Candidatus Eisenbacteria bacterium]